MTVPKIMTDLTYMSSSSYNSDSTSATRRFSDEVQSSNEGACATNVEIGRPGGICLPGNGMSAKAGTANRDNPSPPSPLPEGARGEELTVAISSNHGPSCGKAIGVFAKSIALPTILGAG